ncbi:hypothetical protein JOC77_002782 [Peribacillus deserti]|uniref:Uncharacterized protein n=1 Tax=Peribacillus deserti TaxID=673318 RepID=A0ABS2QJR6_9BACI|nr:hypothetical protein [Peribacillus deserti]MBM7693342.1 hypothetical protein [Peribacillus deserti]
MTVNHGGALKKEYFLSYIKLVWAARACCLAHAKDLTLELFFKNNKKLYGKDTYKSFMDAYEELTKSDAVQ